MTEIIDTYFTIKDVSYGEYKEKGSKFIALAYPITNESDLEEHIRELKGQHLKARHFCYAYKIGISKDRYRINDDGEPSGTAGKPIMGQIQSFGLTDIGIVVIRYFGGTKLGVSGLIRAYKEAAKLSLEAAEIVKRYITVSYRLIFDYSQMGHILNAIKDADLEITDKSFEENCTVNLQIRKSMEEDQIHRLKALILNKSMEEVTFETVIDFCVVRHLNE